MSASGSILTTERDDAPEDSEGRQNNTGKVRAKSTESLDPVQAGRARIRRPRRCTRCGHDPEAEHMRFRELMGHLLPSIKLPPWDTALMAVMTPPEKRAVWHLRKALGRWMEAVDRAMEHGQGPGPWELVLHVPPLLRPAEDLPVEIYPPRRPLV